MRKIGLPRKISPRLFFVVKVRLICCLSTDLVDGSVCRLTLRQRVRTYPRCGLINHVRNLRLVDYDRLRSWATCRDRCWSGTAALALLRTAPASALWQA